MLRKRLDPEHLVPNAVEDVGSTVLDCAFDVHTLLGPGLLEAAYTRALGFALEDKGLRVEREVPIHASYRGRSLGLSYRADLVIDGAVLVEVKAADAIHAAHEAQLVTYLRFSGLPLGFLFNFHEHHLRHGFLRRVGPSLLPRTE